MSRVSRRRRAGAPSRWAALLVSLCVAVGLAGSASAAPARPDDSAGSGASRLAAAPLELGVTVFALWRDWSNLDTILARVEASGSAWLRVDMGWCSLQERGHNTVSQWYQDRLDTVIAKAAAADLRVLVTVACTPAWAGGDGGHGYPSDPAAFEEVMRYLSHRYRNHVDAWEIWNEPDCVGGCGNGRPAPYVPILRAGFAGVRAGDPTATVVTGGTSGNNARWIAGLYAAGARGSFDAIATHPYLNPATAGPWAAKNGSIYRMRAVSDVRAVMVANGDAAKRIWFTEFGWTTASTGPRLGVTPAAQATYLTQSVDLLTSQYPYVTHAFWYTMRDRDDWTPYENSFGLLTVDGTPKPALQAFTAANRRLAGG